MSPLLALPKVVSRVGETPPLAQDCPSEALWPASPREERLGSGWRKTPKWEAQMPQALVVCKAHSAPFLSLHWHRQLGQCAPGQSPKTPLRPTEGTLPEPSHRVRDPCGKRPVDLREVKGIYCGHSLALGNNAGKMQEGGASLRIACLWKGAWRCRKVPPLSMSGGLGRLISILGSWPYLRGADSTGALWAKFKNQMNFLKWENIM